MSENITKGDQMTFLIETFHSQVEVEDTRNEFGTSFTPPDPLEDTFACAEKAVAQHLAANGGLTLRPATEPPYEGWYELVVRVGAYDDDGNCIPLRY